MRPAEFPAETIIQAGKELLAAGRPITGFALRTKVGGGNAARLKQVWDEHISQAVTHTETVAELPPEVADEVAGVSKELTGRLAALAVELNDRAVKAADRRVAEVVRSAGEQREQAERELADAAVTVDDLETRLDAAGAEGAQLQKEVVELAASNQTQAVELAQLRERLASVEQQAQVAGEQHAATAADLRGQLDDLQGRFDGLTNTYQERTSEVAQLRERLSATEAQAQAAAGQHVAALADLRAKLEKAEAYSVDLGVSYHKVQGELYAATAATASENEFRRKAETELESAMVRVGELERSGRAMADELAALKAAGAAAEAEGKRIAERLTKAEGERDASRLETGKAREDAATLRGQVETLQAQAGEIIKALGNKQRPGTAAPK